MIDLEDFLLKHGKVLIYHRLCTINQGETSSEAVPVSAVPPGRMLSADAEGESLQPKTDVRKSVCLYGDNLRGHPRPLRRSELRIHSDVSHFIRFLRPGKLIYDKFMSETEIPQQDPKKALEEPVKTIGVSIPEFSFQEAPLLKDINLEFEAGKKYLFLGPSGCGKSTMMKMIGSQIKSDFITVNGCPSSEYAFSELMKNIGYMDQNSVLLPWTLKENLTLQRSEDEEEMTKLLEKMDLSKVYQLHKYEIYPPLSGGELQRTALTRLLFQNRKWIILDEPFSALDQEKTETISRSILENPELTVISVEHKPLDDLLPLYDYIFTYQNGTFVEVN